MGLQQDLANRVDTVIRQKWKPRDGTVVPDPEDVTFNGDAVKLDSVVLYADMVGSSALVQTYPQLFAAEMLKCILDCSARVIRACGGEITAYDGDRIMAVFLGDRKNTSAGFAALNINHTVKKIINPAVTEFYKNTDWFAQKPYEIKHVVGVDSGELHIAKTGVRGANDIVWVGRPAFFAAKLSALRFEDYPSFLTY